MILSSTWNFLQQNAVLLNNKLVQHLALSLSATTIAILLGIPLGIMVLQRPKLRAVMLSITSLFQTIPSLALLAFLIPILGIGIRPTVVTLTLYALLPITRNTFTGLSNVPPESREAARAIGLTPWQSLRLVELPLALPIIIAGIRTATAMTIGITTIAAFIGAGGLGDFITQGLALNNSRLILLGAIPTALLALSLDFVIANIEHSLQRRSRDNISFKKTRFISAITICLLLLMFVIQPFLLHRHKNTITIATKNFTEQYILGDLMSDMIKAHTKLHIKKKFNLGTTLIAQHAMEKGDIDLYPEYTGTGYLVVLKQHKRLTPEGTYQFVKKHYEKQFSITWLAPFGFNNSQTLAVTRAFAKQHHVKTLSDLAHIAPRYIIAAPPDFLRRADSFPALKKAYNLNFKHILQMQPDLMYEAIKNRAVNIIEIFTTDGRIAAYHLLPLKDPSHIYPPYYAAPVIRMAFLKTHPEVAKALAPLANRINQKTITHLNYLVNVKHQTPEKVAHDYLLKNHLI